MMKKGRFLLLLTLALMSLVMGGCSKVKDIKVTSCGIQSFTPTGLKSADALLLLGIDNPAFSFIISDVNGSVKYNGAQMGSFTAGELPVMGKSAQVYELPCSAALAKGMSMMDLLSFAARKSFEGVTMDLSLNVKLKNGVGKTFNFKDLPVQKMIDAAEKSSNK